VTALSTAYEASTQAHRVTITGSGFAGDVSETELYIDGFKQTTISVTSGQLIFDIVNMLDSTSSDIKLYLAEGIPNGMDAITSITVQPSFVSLSP